MRLKGSEMVFPEGTEFFDKEEAPLAKLPDGSVVNAFGGMVREYPEGADPTKVWKIDRAEFDRLVDASYGMGFEPKAALTSSFAKRSMRLKGSELAFPPGTRFFDSESAPYAIPPNLRPLNCISGSPVEDMTLSMAPWTTKEISRAEFDELVDANDSGADPS